MAQGEVGKYWSRMLLFAPRWSEDIDDTESRNCCRC